MSWKFCPIKQFFCRPQPEIWKKNPFIFITFYLHADIGSHISSIDEGELWKMSKNLIVGSKTGDQKKRLLLLLPMLFIRNFRYFPKESPVGSPTGLWMFNLFTSCGLWWHLVYTHYTLKHTLLHRPIKTMNEPIFSPIMINYASNTHKYIWWGSSWNKFDIENKQLMRIINNHRMDRVKCR